MSNNDAIDHGMEQATTALACARRAAGHLECVGKFTPQGWDFVALAVNDLRAALALLGDR